MALVSVSPSASKWCLHKSLMSFTPELKPLCGTNLTARMPGRGKSVMRCLSMSLTTNVQRRIGDHHSNLWNDDILQSLSTSYGESSYRERAGRLIGEVKKMFDSMLSEDGEFSPLNDLIQRLWMVDSVERLGIDRHFRNEIKSALDYVYSFWKEKGIGCGRDSVVTDLNSTALGLRTLRLHGYAVSAEVLKLFKGQNGQFACSAVQREGEIEIRSVVNLYRASLIAFPGEKVMEEAQIFSARYLKETLQKIPVSSLSREIGDILDNGWHTNLPRLEARNYIDVFIQDTKNTKTEKLLELAKLEFNMFHSLQKKELECLLRWWKDSGVPQMTFCRHRHVEYYALASCIAFEPQHSGFRLGFAKASHIITVLDDMYDIFGTVDELELFTAAIKRWDPSATEWLPEYMKPVYMMVYDTVNEMAREAEKAQGRDTLDYARKAWEVCLDSWMQEAKWIASGYLPSFEEYYENGKVSSAHRVCALQPILTLPDIPFPDHIFKRVDFPSKLNDLACAVLRLRGDTRCYKADRARGEEASSISCYMKENPGSTEEDALNHINGMISDVIRKLNWELLKPDSVPICAKKHAYDISRAFHYGYKYRDGYSVADIEMKNFVAISVLEPVPL